MPKNSRCTLNLKVKYRTKGRISSKELESIMNSQAELKKTRTKMQNTLEGINSRLDNTDKGISNLEDRLVGINHSEQQNKHKNFKN